MSRRAPVWVGSLLPLLLAGGCVSHSRVQARYEEEQNLCRIAATAIAPAAESDATVVGSRFSECMNKLGWHVPAPKPATPPSAGGGTQVVQNPPSGSPSTNPIASARPQPAAAIAPVASPAPATAAVAAPPVARYQPARPLYSYPGTGDATAGRQF